MTDEIREPDGNERVEIPIRLSEALRASLELKPVWVPEKLREQEDRPGGEMHQEGP